MLDLCRHHYCAAGPLAVGAVLLFNSGLVSEC